MTVRPPAAATTPTTPAAAAAPTTSPAASASASVGTLTLVSTPIGNLGDISPRAIAALGAARLICCEDTRHSGKLLAHVGVSGVRLAVCNEHTEQARAAEVVATLRDGHGVAVVTDAGTPGISDPGARLIRAVIDAGYPVTAVPGPAALVTALVLSGLDTTRFVFDGFLPRSGRERSERIADIASQRRTTVLYEAPHRIERTIADLAESCGAARPVALARELTKLYEDVWRGTLADAMAHLASRPARGEYVIVIGGAPPSDSASDAELTEALRSELAGGADRRTAISTVVDRHHVPKRRVYDLAVALKSEARS